MLQEKNIENEKYIPSKQSANVLFKFMKKIEYLKEIISKKAIIPRYYEESIDYLNIESLNKIVFFLNLKLKITLKLKLVYFLKLLIQLYLHAF